jgi:predicted kinase
MQTITFTRGLPASGKSTWAKEQVVNGNGKIVRVNMDDIRSMLGLPYSVYAEELALRVQDQAILSAVKSGRDVIVDNTHIEKKMPTRIKKLFDGDVLFKIKDFTDVPLGHCLERDQQRVGSAHVGADVIRRMHARLQKVSITEDWLNDVKLSPVYKPKAGSDACVVFDIDGTLAEHVARSPYDYSRVHTDALIQHIANLNQLYWDEGYEIIIMSGRPDSCRTETEKWLKDHSVKYTALFMRDKDDKRNDADVKQDLFDEHVRDNYWVHAWFDDRDRVVRRMRKLGLNVLQVADGDF